MKIGLITLADPVITPPDKYVPEIEKAISRIFEERSDYIRVLVHDRAELQIALLRLCDEEKCPLVITSGGTGPSPRDISPEVTLAVLDRELPGFGEAIRHHSFQRGPIALLSRAVAGVRGGSLVMNLPSRPKPVLGCLKLLREAMVECMDQIAGVRHQLHVDEIEIPLEKWMPFLKRFRIKPDPRWAE
jgi:molybdopterin adenylyltransferase